MGTEFDKDNANTPSTAEGNLADCTFSYRETGLGRELRDSQHCEMELSYKKIEEKDKEQLFEMIDTVLSKIPESHFVPYSQWEYDNMFDEENYALTHGAYDGDKLVGMSQLYVNKDMLEAFKEAVGLSEEEKVCELGGGLVLEEYRGKGIAKKLQEEMIALARERGFKYIISKGHPDNKISNGALETYGFKLVKEEVELEGYLRSLYVMEL